MNSIKTNSPLAAVAVVLCTLFAGCSSDTSTVASPTDPAASAAGTTSSLKIVRLHPAQLVVGTASETPIGVEFTRADSAQGDVTATLLLNGLDVSAQARTDAHSVLYRPPQPLPEGLHEIRLRLIESDGTTVEENWSFVVGDRPALLDFGPKEIEVPAEAVVISARFADPSLAIDTSRIRLEVDGVDVSDRIELKMDTPGSGSLEYRPSPALEPGRHRVELELANEQGFALYEPWGFWVARQAQRDILILFPTPDSTTDRDRVSIGVRPYSSRASVRDVRIQGLPTESSNFEDGYLHHYADIDLVPGNNRIEAVARFMDGTEVKKVFHIRRSP